MKILLAEIVLDDIYDKWSLSNDELLKRVVSPINAGVQIKLINIKNDTIENALLKKQSQQLNNK